MVFDKKEKEQLLRDLLIKKELIKGTYYRISRSLYKDKIISGIGAKQFPGRWMKEGICYVLYASNTIETAYNEVIRSKTSYYDHYVLATLNVSCSDVLNLNVESHLKYLGLKKKDLLSSFFDLKTSNESITQFLGRIAFEIGFLGLVVPSVVSKNGENLVLFSKRTPIPNVKVIQQREFTA